MKKIILFLILSITAFAWQKQNIVDDFGDATSQYIIYQGAENEDCILSIGKSNEEVLKGSGPSIIAYFAFLYADFGDNKTDVKIKIKTKNGIEKIDGCAIKRYIFTANSIETKKLLRALRDNNSIKVAIGSIILKFNAVGFSQLYKTSFWQGFDDSMEITMPPKGEKTFSVAEGEIEKQDDIWYHDERLK